jgi:DNA helicase-2/ATP-dependent DNA helicase PcrA
MDIFAGLNPPQCEAVQHVEGPMLILAGAGSGKTRVVTHRIANLVINHGVVPESILAVTFTNKAAAEMKERIQRILGGAVAPGRGPRLSTFHSFCVQLLRRDGAALAEWRPGFTRQFLIYDDDDQLAVVKGLCKRHGIDDTVLSPRNALSMISAAKNRREGPAEFARHRHDPKMKWMAALYEQYNDALAGANALDFDDLLLEAVRLLSLHEPTRDSWRRRLQFLMIDEYQDTNRTQYELVKLLSGPARNVCVVGDEDQSIYSWRGADIRNILDFERDFPSAKVVRLEQNYRSTKNILEAASSVIANNRERKGKWLWTDSGDGPKITVYTARDGETEGNYIAETVEKLLRRDPSLRVAVLYRTNAQSRLVEEGLRRMGRPYKIVGGLSFYQRAEVKDTIAYLKLLLVPNDPVSLLRVINTPARGIGKTTIEQLDAYARTHGVSLWKATEEMTSNRLLPGRAENALRGFRSLVEDMRAGLEHKPINAVLSEILERTGYRRMLMEDTTDPARETRLENLNELLNAGAEASARGQSPAEFLDHAALVSDADGVDQAAQVSLMTVHNAKGLEFPVVFLAGMEEGLFPHSRSESASALEEERRLCYVGITRAEKRLYVTSANVRRRYGGGPLEPAIRSRFIAELPRALCDFQGAPPPAPPRSGDRFDDEIEDLVRDDVDLFAERSYVRESVKATTDQIRRSQAPKTQYPGKTYNSVENVAQFFRDRGIPGKVAQPDPPAVPKPASLPVAKAPPAKKKKFGVGSVVEVPKFGRGEVVRVEGSGDDTKVTMLFPGHGLKKLVAKYAGIKIDP